MFSGIMCKPFYVMVFRATEDTMRAEKILSGRFDTAIMPTPREISESCGFAIRFENVLEKELIKYAAELNVSYRLYYFGEKVDDKKRILSLIVENKK